MSGEEPRRAAHRGLQLEASMARRLQREEERRRAAQLERSQARFEQAVARPPAGDPAHAAVLEQLVEAPITGIGRVVYSSNAVFVLELEGRDPSDPERPLRAIYKPARGERPLWDFPFATLHFREVATYLVDAALGFFLVPPTALRDGPAGPGSVQLFVDVLDRDLTGDERAALDPVLQRMGALDVLVNNADRKSAHLLVTPAGLRGIDHGLTFLPHPRQRTVLLELGGRPLLDADVAALRALRGQGLATLRDALGMLLDTEEVQGFERRLEALQDEPVYPVLDPWEGRPFEWW